jgi:hypothetical protein
MSRHRSLVLAVAVVVLLATVSGTGGFSSAEADRSVDVAIANDDSAFVGFEQATEETNRTVNLTVAVTNQLPSDTGLSSVSVTVGGESQDIGPLGAGERDEAEFRDIDCDSSTAVDASGADVSVQFSRDVEC